MQPDLPPINTLTGTLTPNAAVDANGDKISDSTEAYTSVTSGGPYDAAQSAAARAVEGSIDPALIENETVLVAPKTGGSGTGYGAFSGGTPGGAASAAKIIQDLTYTSRFPGLQGNGTSVQYADTVEAGSETVVVNFKSASIVVNIDSGESTATQVLAALTASQDALSLVSAVISGTAGTAQVTAAKTPLLGGTNTPSDGDGALTNTKGSFSAINRSGSRNNASINVISRPGDNQGPQFLF
jgi:hypothetical protein